MVGYVVVVVGFSVVVVVGYVVVVVGFSVVEVVGGMVVGGTSWTWSMSSAEMYTR